MPPIETYRPALVGGRYRVTEVFRQMAGHDIVAAHDNKGDRDVVLGRVPAPSRNDLQRLRGLTNTLKALDHPSLGRVIGMKETRGDAWLISERVRAPELWDWLNRQPIPERAGFEARWRFLGPIVASLLDALEAMHEAGLAHLDVKPANVRVLPTGRAVLVGPGLGQGLREHEPLREDLESRWGFVAPELVEGFTVSKAADQFSLGALIYMALTERKALPGHSIAELRKAYKVGRAQPVSSWLPDVPGVVEDVVGRLLKWEPEDRFETITQVRTALGELVKPAPRDVAQPWSCPPPAYVGRDPFNSFFRKRMIELKQGKGSVVRLLAREGFGKTRLLESWREQAEAEGDITVHSAFCLPDLGRTALAGWFDPPACDPQGAPPANLVEQALDQFHGPTVLLFDSMEALDAPAWARIHRAAEAAAKGTHRLIVVLSGRAMPPLAPRIPEDTDRLFNVGLPPLDIGHVRALLEPETDDPEDLEVRDAAAQSFRDQSGGVPGRLFPLLLLEQAEGRAKREGARWRVSLSGEGTVGGGLPPMMPQFLAWLAKLVDHPEVELLLGCLPLGRANVLSCLEYGAREGIFKFRLIGDHWRVVGGAEAASSTTELYGTAEVHSRVAQWLAQNLAADGLNSERIGHQWRQAGNYVEAVAAYKAAAQAHWRVGSNTEGRRIAQLAAAFGPRGRK